jgi:hypothetical protein
MERPGNQSHPVFEIQTERPGLPIQAHLEILKRDRKKGEKRGQATFLKKVACPLFYSLLFYSL